MAEPVPAVPYAVRPEVVEPVPAVPFAVRPEEQEPKVEAVPSAVRPEPEEAEPERTRIRRGRRCRTRRSRISLRSRSILRLRSRWPGEESEEEEATVDTSHGWLPRASPKNCFEGAVSARSSGPTTSRAR
jgi:hypothetical protein